MGRERKVGPGKDKDIRRSVEQAPNGMVMFRVSRWKVQTVAV